MITTILSLLGISGGIGLAVAFIPGFGKRLIEIGGALLGLVRDHPWQAACCALALWGAWERWDAIDARAKAAAWKVKWDRHVADDKASIARAIDWRDKYQSASAELAGAIKEKTDAENRLTSALGSGLRLRGPGRATALCGPRGSTGPAATASGPEAPGGGGDAPLAPVPDDEPMAIVPWNGLVRFGEEADANRTEVMAWREWYAREAELLKARKAELPAPAFGN